MPDLSGASLTLSVVLFVVAALAILLAGTRLTGVADAVYRRANLEHAAASTANLA